jgi:4-hydroxybenzoate polyprenyltransferase
MFWGQIIVFWWVVVAVAIFLIVAAAFVVSNLVLDRDIDQRARGRDDD